MKDFYAALIACALVFWGGCGESPGDSRYALVMPGLPPAWKALLGEPQWQFEWTDGGGFPGKMTAGGGAEISVFQASPNAVSAWPFWPDRGIGPGVFRPAGAVFPHDVSGRRLVLSWQGGVEAFLFRELAAAGRESGGWAAVPRLPENFNWPRFRRLFEDPSVNAEVRADPWLADWGGIAEKIAQSGFDKRRLVPEARGGLAVPVGPGPWIGTSPFAPPLLFEAAPVFPVRPAADTWVSAAGLLRCNAETWILREFSP